MPRFLHLADVHLGFDRYDSRERTKDFFYAFQDALQRYAIDEQVDFVVIAGDLFEHRNIQPNILNQAQVCLRELQAAQIPVLAIEGNHDNRPYGTPTSWLRYLADWGLLILLEPGNVSAGEPFYEPWNADQKRGGYIDLDCGVRVLGSNWYGAAAPRAIAQIAESLGQLPPVQHTILLFHHGIEGQIARYQGALRYSDILPLKQVGVDYLALGHIHKSYAIENWVFNPGSIEANSVEEGQFDRGVYLVDINESGVQAELKQDYQQRSIVRLKLVAKGQESADELAQLAIAHVQQSMQSQQIDPAESPIVELRIEGNIGFERSELDTRRLQQQLQEMTQALIFLLRYEVETIGYATPLSQDATRLQIEQEIFGDLLSSNTVYRKRAVDLSRGLIELKDRQLSDQPDLHLYEFVQDLLPESEPKAG